MQYTTVFRDQRNGRWTLIRKTNAGFTHILLGKHINTLDEAISESCIVHHVPKAVWVSEGETWARTNAVKKEVPA